MASPIIVDRSPLGPAIPDGGWTAVMADAFNPAYPLSTLWGPNRNNNAHDGGLLADCGGFNSNEVAAFNASKVSLHADGLHLTASYDPGHIAPAGSSLTPATHLTSPLSTGSPIASLPVAATPGPYPDGWKFVVYDSASTLAHRQVWTLNGAHAQGVTALTVLSQTPNFAYPATTSPVSSVNYVAGCVSSQPVAPVGGQAGFPITGFGFLPTPGVTMCFEIVLTMPAATAEVGGDMGWWALSPAGQNELDFFEWLNYTTAVPPPQQWGVIASAIDHVGVTSTGNEVFNLAQQNDGLPHRWTTLIDGDAETITTYIDGVKQSALSYAWVAWNAQPMNLILSHALRSVYASQAPSFTGSLDVIVRQVACYQPADQAGMAITGGGIAPGTLVLDDKGVLILDPPAVATGRVALSLNDDPGGSIRLAKQGIDWGDAAIQAYMADSKWGSTAVDFRVPNRTVRIPLFIGANDDGQDGFDAAYQQLRQKVALIQREGGWLQRGWSTPMYADIENATLNVPDVYGEWGAVEPDVVLTLECLPDFYGDEITLDTITATGCAASKLQRASATAAIDGDHPARVRIIASDASAHDQHGLLWGIRSRHYDAATTAALKYEAEALTPISPGASGALTGASGGNAVTASALPGGVWCPILSTDLSGTGPLTHQGSYRVWARIYSGVVGSNVAPEIRLVWWTGETTRAATIANDAVRIPSGNAFYLVDLGEIRLDPVPVGASVWRGAIQAKAELQGDPVSIDQLYLQPLDEGAGIVTAIPSSEQGGSALARFDGFDQGIGTALNGATAPIGGTWSGAGSSTGYTIEGSFVQRTVTGDTPLVGRYAILGSALGAYVVSCDIEASATARVQGVMRYVDTNNWAMLGFEGSLLNISKRIGGTLTSLDNSNLAPGEWVAGNWYTLRFAIDASGRWWAWFGPQGGPLTLRSTGYDAVFDTGGALHSVAVGIYDEQVSGVSTRKYDNFSAWALNDDAAIFSSDPAELRTDGMIREATGGSYAPIGSVYGDLPRLPVSGIEGRPVEVFVRPSRGDLATVQDSGIDSFTAQVIYRPCYLGRR